MSTRRLWPILLLAALLGLANIYATPAFWPVDETAHVAYAVQLVETGRLPHIDAPIQVEADYPGLAQRLAWERDQHRDGRQDIWTSNHPPLPYLVQGTALAVGDAVGNDRTALGLARLTSVAWLVLGVWASMRLAFLLAPAVTVGRRRLQPHEVAFAVGTLVAVTPTLTHLAGLVFNDVPAFTMSTLCVLVGTQAAFTGLTPRRMTWVGLLAGAAALTRISCLPAVAVMVALAAYGWWRQPAGMRAAGAGRAWLISALALVPAAAFWVRNVVLYGDLTAATALFEKFDRDLNDPLGVLLPDPNFWYRLWNRMWADLTTGHWAVGLRAQITVTLLFVLLLATAVAVVRAIRHLRGHGHQADDLGRARPAAPLPLPAWARRSRRVRAVARALAAHPRRVAWTVSAVLPLSLLVSAVQFHSAGGSLHGRYLLGGHAVTATAIVLALAGIPRIGPTMALLVSVPIFVVNVALVQSLMIHHISTWDRPGIRLILPSIGGHLGQTIAVGLLWVAGAVLVGVLAQHWLDRRATRRRAPAAATPQPASAPIRSMRESAAR